MDFTRKGPEVIEIGCSDGKRVLFSYGHPVALYVPGRTALPSADGWMRTDAYVSRTTEQHIKDFLGRSKASRVPTADIVRLTREAC